MRFIPLLPLLVLATPLFAQQASGGPHGGLRPFGSDAELLSYFRGQRVPALRSGAGEMLQRFNPRPCILATGDDPIRECGHRWSHHRLRKPAAIVGQRRRPRARSQDHDGR